MAGMEFKSAWYSTPVYTHVHPYIQYIVRSTYLQRHTQGGAHTAYGRLKVGLFGERAPKASLWLISFIFACRNS